MRGGEPIGPFPYSSQHCNDLAWADWIDKSTQGRLTVEFVPVTSLFPHAETKNALRDGVVDVSPFTYTGYWAGDIPEAQIESGIPFNCVDPQDVNTLAYYYGVEDIFREVYAGHNIMHLATYPLSPQITVANFDMATPEAFKGKKIRAAGYDGEIYSMLGSSAVSLPAADIYMALKLGTVTGNAANIITMESMKFKEVMTHLLVDPFKMYTVSALVNKDAFDALPEDIKDIILAGTQAVVYQSSSEVFSMEALLAAKLIPEYNIKTNKWSDADLQRVRIEAVNTVWPKLAKMSPGCAKLIDAYTRFLQDFNRI
ncbi:TRAP transporter substrate-binding protein DctP [Chloroflexota bacterium]